MEGVGKNGEGPGWRGEGGTGDGDSILLAFQINSPKQSSTCLNIPFSIFMFTGS